eukprot:1357935-Pyramimonas_sp.AAC.1
MIEFREWAGTAPAIGVLHRKRGAPSQRCTAFRSTVRLVHPKDIMDFKSREWERVWAPNFLLVNGPHAELSDLRDLFAEIRDRVRCEALPDLTMLDI